MSSTQNNAGSASAATGLTVNYTQGTPLSAGYLHVAFVFRRTVATQPTTPSGWTLADSATTGTQWLGTYVRLSDGTVNGIGFSGESSSDWAIQLAAYAVYDTANAYQIQNPGGVSTSVTSKGTPHEIPTEAGQTISSFMGLSNTAGGTGMAWSNSYSQRSGGSASSTSSWAEKDAPTYGVDINSSVTWTTARSATASTILLSTTQPVSPTGLASAEAWGTAVKSGPAVTASPTGLASAEAWGAASLSGGLTVGPIPITSGEVWGAVTITGGYTVSPAGIASALTFTTSTVTTNLSANPNFEVDVSGWSAYVGVAAPSRVTGDSFSGAGRLQAVGNGGSTYPRVTSQFAAAPGEVYSISARIRADGVVPSSAGLNIKPLTGATEISGQVDTTAPWAPDALGYVYITSSVTIPAGGDGFRVNVGARYSSSLTSAGSIGVDEVLVVKSGTLGNYFDGSSPTEIGVGRTATYAWTGTANASTSTQTVVTGVGVSGLLTVSPTGISTAEVFGVLYVPVTPLAIASGEAFGTAAISVGPYTASPTGIASGEAFGFLFITGNVTVSPVGIGTAEAFGTTYTNSVVTVPPVGIPSGESFGSPALNSNGGKLVQPAAGIPSGESFGMLTISGRITIRPGGISTKLAFGQAVVYIIGNSDPALLGPFGTGIGIEGPFG